jgi:four helix bundle protein
MRDFKKLLIWQKAMDIVIDVYKIAKSFPADEKFGLKSQATRSAVSIAANIAEGSAKSSEREYKHFCETALGSCYELETHLLVAGRLGWVQTEKTLSLIMEEQKMLMAFIDKLGGGRASS